MTPGRAAGRPGDGAGPPEGWADGPLGLADLSGRQPDRPPGWVFWEPTPSSQIEAALDLAGLKAGEHLVDLGCGNGEVLVAAAARGATALGYEVDPALATQARERSRLAGVGDRVSVVVADFRQVAIQADVVYAFLSPASLTRLRPQFMALRPGARVVTVKFEIHGWRSAAAAEGCYLYRIPPQPAHGPVPVGWPSTAFLVAARANSHSIIPLLFGAGPGELRVVPSGELSPSLDVLSGEDVVSAASIVPVDLRWRPRPKDTVAVGELCAQDASLTVGAVYTETSVTWWSFHGAEESRALRSMIHEIADGRRSAESLLDAARAGARRLRR